MGRCTPASNGICGDGFVSVDPTVIQEDNESNDSRVENQILSRIDHKILNNSIWLNLFVILE
ncbi:MAG: hypothetical protein BAJALOKI2v1_200039 [Promethearchaeota archaeon]|nr:MAG: hypothetical protein BAJALOKI2v1_200039 [Candidatus Lokiarchaeota archaeon]